MRSATPNPAGRHVSESAPPPIVKIIYQSESDGGPVYSEPYATNFNKGLDAYYQKDYQTAMTYFHAADTAQPGVSQCVVMLAVCYENRGQQEAALKIYAHALQLDPHYALAWHNKGVLHNERGELTDAKECYLNALRDRIMSGQPEFKTVACNLSSVLVKLQEHEAACRLLSEVIRRDPKDFSTAAWLADIYVEAKQPAKAYDLLSTLPNNGRLKEGMMLLAKSKMADILVTICPPHAFRLPKAPRLAHGYEAAVEQAVAKLLSERPNAELRVTDTDSMGWLAMKALQSGCKKATCLIRPWDNLKKSLASVLERNGYTTEQVDIQHFIAEEVTAWHGVFENADLFINAIYTPASVPSILQRCKSYQQKGLTTVPRGGCLKIMGICSEQIRTQCTVGSEVNGFDLTNFGDFCTAIRKYVMHMHMSTINHEVLTEVAELELEADHQGLFGKTIRLPVLKEGILDAIVSWYDLDLADDMRLSMGPDADCAWQQNIQVVHFDGDSKVRVGDCVVLDTTLTRWTSERSNQWIMFENIVHEVNGAITQRHDTHLLSEDPLQGRLWHFDMMADLGRNDAYDRALKALVKPEHVVLDIGTGSGLLAMMAARAGAKHVYAIEANESIAEKARKVIAHNGYADKITVITGMSDNISVGEGSAMPVKADVVVTETMGADLLSELMYNILDDARRRLAKPGAVLIPWAGRVIGQLVQVNSPWHVAGFPKTEGLKHGAQPDLSSFNPLLPPMRICLQIQKMQWTPISDVFTLFSFDFNTPLDKAGNTAEIKVPITAAGQLHAIAYWWDADLGSDADGKIEIETGPTSRYAYTDHAHWSQQIQVLDFDGVQVASGQEVPLRMYNDNHLSYIELI